MSTPVIGREGLLRLVEWAEAANRARAESLGAPREGPALLGGLVACGI